MYEIIVSNVNPNKFHDELGLLDIPYQLCPCGENECKLQFHTLCDESTENEDGTINCIVKVVIKGIEVVDGVETEIEVYSDFDIVGLEQTIASVIANHDPTPRKEPITENEKLWDAVNYLIESGYM